MITGWNVPPVREFNTDFADRFEYCCQQAQATGIRYFRIDLRAKFTGGPEAFDATERQVYGWIARRCVEYDIIPLFTFISFVSNSSAWRAIRIAETAESDAFVQANFGNMFWTGSDTGPTDYYWPGLLLQHQTILDHVRSEYIGAGGDWSQVYIQFENEPKKVSDYTIPTTFDDWMDYVWGGIDVYGAKKVGPSLHGGTVALVEDQCDSITGAWISDMDYSALNLYSPVSTYKRRWEWRHMREIRDRTAPVVAKFPNAKLLLTESSVDEVVRGSRNEWWLELVRGVRVARRHPVQGVFLYSYMAHSDDRGDEFAILDYTTPGVTLPTADLDA